MVVVEELEEQDSKVVAKRAVDYGDASDGFVDDDEDEDEFNDGDDDEDDDSGSDEEHVVLLVNPLGEDDDDGKDSDDDEDGDDDIVEDEEGEEDSEDLDDEDMENDDDDDDEDDDDEEDAIKGEELQRVAKTLTPSTSSMGEQCTFDIRNLLAMNTHQISVNDLYTATSKKSKDEKVTISGDKLPLTVNEAHLLEKALDGCTQLVSVLWQLPTEQSDVGPLISLPPYDEIKLPRALPPPAPKQETKWEKFAKERGMPQNKAKRTRKVWDEATSTWMFRHGYQKANDDKKEWPIMEVKRNDDPNEDPWERLRDSKRKHTDKNLHNRMRNEERAGALPKGTTTRVMKSRDKVRKVGKIGGNMDRDTAVPVGVPVDLLPRKGDKLTPAKRGKESTMAALKAVQQSTASLGKFDKMREGEPERKKPRLSSNKKKIDGPTDKRVLVSEREKGMKLLNAVLTGGGAAKEKARKKGAFAKGETAYDYDYNDGLGASSFKKKKGRAGAGKMKKMTKKRVK